MTSVRFLEFVLLSRLLDAESQFPTTIDREISPWCHIRQGQPMAENVQVEVFKHGELWQSGSRVSAMLLILRLGGKD